MPVRVRITAPSRLHFGLLSFGRPGARQFGGAGVMIDAPGLVLSARTSQRLSAGGPLAQRVLEFARRYAAESGAPSEPVCHFEVESAPPEHAGLGTGTQLALAVAAALDALSGNTGRTPGDWAQALGRGERSAIGTHGFARGGLLVEGGKYPAEAVSPLIARVELPPEWRFAIVLDREERGLSGAAERLAFADLPPVAEAATADLCRELLLHLLPAATNGQFEEFGESLYRYGYRAGMLFAKQQGGAYAGRSGAELVRWMRAQGVRGVGQSSWGPAIFALLPDAAAAAGFAHRLGTQFPPARFTVLAAAPDNRGARIETS